MKGHSFWCRGSQYSWHRCSVFTATASSWSVSPTRCNLPPIKIRDENAKLTENWQCFAVRVPAFDQSLPANGQQTLVESPMMTEPHLSACAGAASRIPPASTADGLFHQSSADDRRSRHYATPWSEQGWPRVRVQEAMAALSGSPHISKGGVKIGNDFGCERIHPLIERSSGTFCASVIAFPSALVEFFRACSKERNSSERLASCSASATSVLTN